MPIDICCVALAFYAEGNAGMPYIALGFESIMFILVYLREPVIRFTEYLKAIAPD